MELKTAKITLLVEPSAKQRFEEICRRQDITPSQAIRRMVREYISRHGAKPSAPKPRPRRGG